MTQTQLHVTGMSCNHCVNAIEGALKKLNVKAEVNLAANTVSVQFDETQVTLDAIKAAIEDQGYDVV